MKPDCALATEMEESDLDPSELFEEVGMLVVESRVPQPSAKGRIEGPHCPVALGDVPKHRCDADNIHCAKAEVFGKQMQLLWRNNIPMCIEVLLLPECEHGTENARHVDVSLPAVKDRCMLLEQWTVQVLPKRSIAQGTSSRALFQAVRSYLYFSQLSAWLNLTHGSAPRNVAYRISPPGEFCTSSFQSRPEVHKFPVCQSSKQVVMKVTVSSLPRLQGIPTVDCCGPPSPVSPDTTPAITQADSRDRTCSCCSQGAVGGGGAARGYHAHHDVQPPSRISPPPHTMTVAKSEDYKSPNYTCKSQGERTSMQSELRQRPEASSAITRGERGELRRPQRPQTITDTTGSSSGARYERTKSMQLLSSATALSHTLSASPYDKAKSPKDASEKSFLDSPAFYSSYTEDNYKNLGAIPKKAAPTAHAHGQLSVSAHDAMPQYGTRTPKSKSESCNTNRCNNKKEIKASTSPKVIVTQKSPGQGYYEKELPPWTSMTSSVISKDSTDSDHSSPDIDKYLHRTLAKSRMEPLSPQEMEDYLHKLCIPKTKTTNKDITSQGSTEHEQLRTSSATICRVQSPQYDGVLPDKLSAFSLPKHSLTNLTAQPCDNIKPSSRSMSPVKHTVPALLKQQQKHDDRATLERRDIQVQSDDKDVIQPPVATRTPDVFQFQNGAAPPAAAVLVSDLIQNGASTRPDLVQNGASKPDISPKSPVRRRLDYTKVDVEVTDEDQSDKVLFSLGDEENQNGTTIKDGSSSGVPVLPKPISSRLHSQSESLSSSEDPTMSDIITPPSSFKDQGSGYACEPQGPVGVQPSRPALHKSVSMPSCNPVPHVAGFYGFNKASSLLKSVMRKEAAVPSESNGSVIVNEARPIPTAQDRDCFQKNLRNSTNMIFHPVTGMPLQSSPAPIKKGTTSHCFDYDCSLNNVRAIKNSISCVNLDDGNSQEDGDPSAQKFYSTSAPASTNSLLGNFEESVLNGRIEPTGVVEGFTAEIGASGGFCPKHIVLPVTAFFFSLSDDNAPSPYLGHINLEPLGKRGYHVPKQGTVQVTLFNPNKAVVKMFVVMYNLKDMPPNCQTFLRQRNMYMPVRESTDDCADAPVFLRYLIHLRFASSKSGKIYLHTDIRMIFARDKLEYDSRVANYELRSFTEGPTNPTFSPKR